MSSTKAKFATALFLLATILLSSKGVEATLIDRGGGLIYDDVLDLTWLQNANLAASNTFGVPGIDASGFMNWFTAQSWISALNTADYLGFSDWRLPVTDGTFNAFHLFAPTNCSVVSEVACRGSELGYMYYYDLGGNQGDDLTGSQGPFTNIQNVYWSGTENPNAPGVAAYGFIFGAGGGGLYQAYGESGIFNSAWAVRDGDVARVSGPASLSSLVAGCALAAYMLRRRRPEGT